MIPSDQELIRKAKGGDNTAFGELWSRYEGQVIALCRSHLTGPYRDPSEDEEDLATTTFIRALHMLDRYEDRSADGVGFGAWLMAVARRICLTRCAKQQRRGPWRAAGEGERERPGGASVEQIVEARELLRIAAEEIHSLPDRYRIPFKLSLEEYSHREIAEKLALSAETVGKQIQRARRMLQRHFADRYGMETATPEARQRRARARLQATERTLQEIVSDCRIVNIVLPGGGEVQLCLRVDQGIVGRESEIEARRAALRNRPHAWKKRLELAEICYHCGRWPEARAEYRQVLAVQPRCFDAALRLGEILRHEHEPSGAIDVYRAALHRQPEPSLAAELRAHLHAAKGDDAAAVALFGRAVALAPMRKTGYYGLHAALGRLSRYQEQLDNLAALRRLDSNDVRAYELAYTPCARLGRFDLARPLLERAVTLDPNNPVAVKHLFQVRMNLGIADRETLLLAERLVRLAPQLADSWGELAWAHAEQNRHDESLAVLQEFLKQHPQNAQAHGALAWRYHYLGRRDEARGCARRAYDLAPHDWFACWTILVASPEIAVAEEIAARLPHDAFLMENISNLYRGHGDESRAVEYAERSIALNPKAPHLRAHLAGVHAAFGHFTAAVSVYRELLRLPGGRNPRWLPAFGSALRATNDPQAEAIFAEAVALAQTADDPLLLGNAFEAWGKREAAATAFRRVLEQRPAPAHVRRVAQESLRRLGALTEPAA